MFIPKINEVKDRSKIISFMQRFSFAIIVTEENSKPIATHLPFVVSVKNEKIILSAHFAKANNQWQNLETKKVLIIFSEPHAYISPSHYETKISVPTWDYISIHAYGKAKLILDEEGIITSLKNTINTYEKEYMPQMKALPDEYLKPMLREIVAFEIEVEELQGKEKLSQNKSKEVKKRIAETLLKSEHSNEKIIGEYIAAQNNGN
jgi:transcriptional regulator